MKYAWAVMVIAGAVAGMLLVLFFMGGFVQDPSGFDEGDLSAPFINEMERNEEHPGPLSISTYPMEFRPYVSYSRTGYASFGGVLTLSIENEGENDLYVHHYYAIWEGGEDTYQVNCSRLIPSGQERSLGELYFAGPNDTGWIALEIRVDVWASSANGELWDDKGEISIGTVDINVKEEDALRVWEVQRNPVRYYNKVNELIDTEAVAPLASLVRSAAPGNYSLLQVIEAYELVCSNISYAVDPENHWQSPAETIALGSGDCEDHSLLLASLITELGGTCRVNLIPGHAFTTVYVGTASAIYDVVKAIQDYYGNPVPVHYTVDELGYWVVIDTNGLPYVGGFPAATSPAGGPGGVNWNFDDGDWIRLIDVTGKTAGSLF